MRSSARSRKHAELAGLDTDDRIEGPRVGRIVDVRDGDVKVALDGREPVSARVSAAIDEAALERAAHERQEVLLLFEEADPRRPVLVSLLRSRTPLIDAALAGPLPAGEKVARVDGRRVEIEGREEVVLRCGKASLTLRRDGKVILRGVNVVSQAEQVQKIRGGKVQIN
jgi:hypothetical protein